MLVAARPARGSAAGVEGSAAGGKGGAVDGKGGAVDGKSSADGLRNDSGAGRARVPAAEVPCRCGSVLRTRFRRRAGTYERRKKRHEICSRSQTLRGF